MAASSSAGGQYVLLICWFIISRWWVPLVSIMGHNIQQPVLLVRLVGPTWWVAHVSLVGPSCHVGGGHVSIYCGPRMSGRWWVPCVSLVGPTCHIGGGSDMSVWWRRHVISVVSPTCRVCGVSELLLVTGGVV